jgi:hypothetical protein
MFADDTCLFVEIDDTEEAAMSLNSDLKSITEWANKWLVTFSPPKTNEMIITKKKGLVHPTLYMGNQEITKVQSHKHLGLILSSNLTWTEHVDYIATKANKLLNYLAPLKMKLDRKPLEIAYFSFIRPIIEYADLVWDNTKPNDHTLEVLDKVNTKAARLVCGATARCNVARLYEENKWETLKLIAEKSIG